MGYTIIYPDGLAWGFMNPADFWSILIIIAWAIYLRVSKRVKETFTVPYNKENYYYSVGDESSDRDSSNGPENPPMENYGPHPLNE